MNASNRLGDTQKRVWFEGRWWTADEFDAETARIDEAEFNAIMELYDARSPKRPIS